MIVEANRAIVLASSAAALASSVAVEVEVEVERAAVAAGRVAAEVSRASFSTPLFQRTL